METINQISDPEIRAALEVGAYDHAVWVAEFARDPFHGTPVLPPDEYPVLISILEEAGQDYDQILRRVSRAA